MQQSQVKFNGKHFLIDLPGKKHKGNGRILLEYLPRQRLALKPIKSCHIFHKDKSIGFNFELINSFGKPFFDIIYIDYKGFYLWTSRLAILHYGKCRTFNYNNLETQIFLKIDLFNGTKDEAIKEINFICNEIANETKKILKKVPGEIDMFEGIME